MALLFHQEFYHYSANYPVSRFPFPVSRFPFPVSRSPFPVPRSPFPFPRSPFLVLRSSIFVARSLFFVGVTSHYWRYNSGQFKQRIPKHHSAVSVLIGKKNIWILRSTLDRKKFQTGSYPAEFTGQLQGILSDIRVQQKKKKKIKVTNPSADLRQIIPRLFVD